MKLTYFGHSCFLIETAGLTFLIDPFITGNALASKIDVNTISCDHILLTHGHGDHILDVEAIAGKNRAHILSNYEIANHYAAKGFQTTGMNHGGWWSFEGGRIKYVHAIHSSSFPDGSYAGNPGGFVIESGETSLYHSGDTALTMDMKLIPLLCKPLTAAILCIGDLFTMGPEDALHASDFVQCDQIIGGHFDTFEAIQIDHEKAIALFESKNKKLTLPSIGESITI